MFTKNGTSASVWLQLVGGQRYLHVVLDECGFNKSIAAMASVMKNAFQVCRALTKSVSYRRTIPMLSVNARLMSSGKISDTRKMQFFG